MEPEEEGFVYRTRRDSGGWTRRCGAWRWAPVALSLLVIAVALLWSGVRGTGFGPPPVITAPPGPLRVAPANPGGLTVPEANVPIMSGVALGRAAAAGAEPGQPRISRNWTRRRASACRRRHRC